MSGLIENNIITSRLDIVDDLECVQAQYNQYPTAGALGSTSRIGDDGREYGIVTIYEHDENGNCIYSIGDQEIRAGQWLVESRNDWTVHGVFDDDKFNEMFEIIDDAEHRGIDKRCRLK